MTPSGLDPVAIILGGTDNPSNSTAYTNPGGGVNLTPAGRPNSQSTAFYAGPGGGSDTNLFGLAAVPVSGAGFEPADAGAFGEDPTGGVTREADGTLRVSGENEQQGPLATTDERSPSQFMVPNP